MNGRREMPLPGDVVMWITPVVVISVNGNVADNDMIDVYMYDIKGDYFDLQITWASSFTDNPETRLLHRTKP